MDMDVNEPIYSYTVDIFVRKTVVYPRQSELA